MEPEDDDDDNDDDDVAKGRLVPCEVTTNAEEEFVAAAVEDRAAYEGAREQAKTTARQINLIVLSCQHRDVVWWCGVCREDGTTQ